MAKNLYFSGRTKCTINAISLELYKNLCQIKVNGLSECLKKKHFGFIEIKYILSIKYNFQNLKITELNEIFYKIKSLTSLTVKLSQIQ